MKVVYAESSALLAWLLGEPKQRSIVKVLAGADMVVTSSLTAIECGRSIARAHTTGRIDSAEERTALQLLTETVSAWNIMELSEQGAELARRPFPAEPIRTLDAIHLASALTLHQSIGSVQLLTLDERIRRNAEDLGLVVVP